MCDHCGCRDLSPIAALMSEHDRLRELTGHIRSDLAAGDDAAARVHFDEVLRVLGPHVGKEEGFLFPMLAREPELTEHVAVLAGEHADLYDAVDDLEDVGPGTEASTAWRAGVLRILDELGDHMFKEDFGLFPAALATLDGSEWDAMDQWVQDQNAGQAAVTPG